MKPSTKVAVIIAAIVCLAVVVVVVTFLNRATASENGTVAEVVLPRRPVQTLIVQPREAAETLERSGVLEARRDVVLTAEVMGKVRKVHRDLGDECESGKPLAQLGAESYSAGVQQAAAALAQAKVGRIQAKQDLERVKSLVDSGVLPSQELERAQNGFDAADAAVKQAEAAVQLAQRSLTETTVRCPFDGVVAERMVDLGALVGPQSPLFRVVDTSELKLTLRVSAAELAAIRSGQAVTLHDSTSDALTYQGRVTRLGVAADPGTHTFPVQISVPGGERGPRPGQVVRASVVIATHNRAILVPSDSVRREGETASVFVARGDKAHRTRVDAGPRIAGETLIRSGLNPGDAVIVVGQEGLAGDDLITTLAPPPSASAAKATVTQ